ncbi:MAG: VWA domain-containing protein [Bacteroidia bacterium]
MPSITLSSAANALWLDSLPRQEWYLYFEIQGADAPPSEQRVPLNLALVLDRSGSMQGDKIAYVRQAAAFVVDHLGAEDTLALVQYDDVIDVLSPAARVRDKAALKRQIQAIGARNNTNLSGGLLEGFTQAGSQKAANRVNRVLLLTDGLANAGVTDSRPASQAGAGQISPEGIGVSTFGGADFNEVMLMGLAEYGGGNYYFIENPDKFPVSSSANWLIYDGCSPTDLVDNFLNGDTACAAKGCTVIRENEGAVRVNFNDVFAGEKKAVLLKLVANAPVTQDALSFHAELKYVDALAGFESHQLTQTIGIHRTADQQAYDQGLDPKLAEQIALFW